MGLADRAGAWPVTLSDGEAQRVLTEGRISLDTVVEVPPPRHRSDPAFGILRTRLLPEPGVEEAPHP